MELRQNFTSIAYAILKDNFKVLHFAEKLRELINIKYPHHHKLSCANSRVRGSFYLDENFLAV
jgi:hypothetical protein